MVDNSQITNDPAALRDKRKVMNTQFINSLFYSTSDAFKFIGAITLAASMGIIGTALKGVTALSEIMPAIAGSEIGLLFLGVAVVCTAVAIGTQFFASRYYHSGNFDALEVNAKHTANYIAKELKKEAACVQTMEHPQNARADGKPWTQVVKPEQSVTQQPTR